MFDFQRILKYLLEGLTVAFVAYYIPRKVVSGQEILLIGITAAATFAILDTFSPSVSESTRVGSGFGIGYNLTGLEGFQDGYQPPQTQQPPQPPQYTQNSDPSQENQMNDDVDVSTIDSDSTDSDLTDTDSEVIPPPQQPTQVTQGQDVPPIQQPNDEYIPQGQEPPVLENYAPF